MPSSAARAAWVDAKRGTQRATMTPRSFWRGRWGLMGDMVIDGERVGRRWFCLTADIEPGAGGEIGSGLEVGSLSRPRRSRWWARQSERVELGDAWGAEADQ